MTTIGERYGPFDIIVDDGSHMASHIITTFETMFPYVIAGGMYVMEDLHTQYLKTYGGEGTLTSPRDGPGTATQYLKHLVDEMNFKATVTGSAGDNRNLSSETAAKQTDYNKRIESIHLYPAIAFILLK